MAGGQTGFDLLFKNAFDRAGGPLTSLTASACLTGGRVTNTFVASVSAIVLFQVSCSAEEDRVNHGTVPHHIHRSVSASREQKKASNLGPSWYFDSRVEKGETAARRSF